MQKDFATASVAACCERLTANRRATPKSAGRIPSCCLCRGQGQPGFPGEQHKGFPPALSLVSPVPRHPPHSTVFHLGRRWVHRAQPSPARQRLCGALAGREEGQRCFPRRVQISLSPHFNATLRDHSSSLWRGSHFTGKP